MAKFKFTLKVWVCVWIMVTGISLGMNMSGVSLPLPVRTLVLSGIIVPSMVFIIIPFLKRREQ
ncbi:hypothetical protein [Salidesulfovibrio onnuriiensis]|uniref:hypothetical protein n=1 Tax=Salidesulfovibrio onnuriiensis TaxID=2583823 RepID=UPI0011C700C6|nr:hypothetical protein [Salidesulfovibrio onnuriiensis]